MSERNITTLGSFRNIPDNRSGIISVKSYNQQPSVKHMSRAEKEFLEREIEVARHSLFQQKADDCVSQVNDNANTEVYEKYSFDIQSPTELPIYDSKDAILRAVETNSTLIITGNTGCGKSTQVPQMILDDARAKMKHCNIIVTQPRRIAARSLAERVSKERGLELGSMVGYQIGLDKRHLSEDTRITFCTTGVLLERLIKTKSLSKFTHIILDEVHEREKDMDFLMIVIRILMQQESTKVILMSATIQTEIFSEYFGSHKNGEWVNAPIIHVEKKGKFPVKSYFLDGFVSDRNLELLGDWQKPGISEALYKFTKRVIYSFFPEFDTNKDEPGSVLVFLPGIHEINVLHSVLTDPFTPGEESVQHPFKDLTEGEKTPPKIKVIILHSMVSSENQQNAFRPVEKGVRKIILSTNIAESSITVPDVKFVIDFCLTRHLKVHASRNYAALELDWASKDNCRQRRGRCGRVAEGRCYHMVPEYVFAKLRQSPTPELLTSPLENVVLRAKQLEMGAPHIILGLAMDTPRVEDVASTVLVLKGLGAMLPTVEGIHCKYDGDLTFIGNMMAGLPVDVRSARLIALGYCFGVLEETIIMAAGLSSKGIFGANKDNELNWYTRHLEWSNGSGSDLFAALNAYRIWTLKWNQGEFGRNTPEKRKAENDFCFKHSLDRRTLHECYQLVNELKKRLDRMGIHERNE